MWKGVGDAASATRRFVRRHRRVIVVGGVVGAAAAVYYRMKRALEEAEEAHQRMMRRAGEDARRRQCLLRIRGECAEAVKNFLPTLGRRLLVTVDISGPVRELSLMRRTAGVEESAIGGNATTSSLSAVPRGSNVEDRRAELWDQVKVHTLTRLVVGLYTFNAMVLMLYTQLHILGRLSFEKSQEVFQQLSQGENASKSTSKPTAAGEEESADWATSTTNGDWINTPNAGIVGSGVALSMEAQRSLLSSTYEHILGGGMRELVEDVKRAVVRCTSGWQAHTCQNIEFQELLATIRRVRLEVESGSVAGDNIGCSTGNGRDGGSRPSFLAGHPLLLRYIINPSPGGGETMNSSRNGGGVSTLNRDDTLRGLAEVLNETWDTAESPHFSLALQTCLDSTFGMVYEQLRQKAFVKGPGRRRSPNKHRTKLSVETNQGVAENKEGDALSMKHSSASPDDQESGGVPPEARMTPDAGIALGVGERDGLIQTQALATVLSQVKVVARDFLEPSLHNEYSQTVAALPAVQDLCFSVFCSSRNRSAIAALHGNVAVPSTQPNTSGQQQLLAAVPEISL